MCPGSGSARIHAVVRTHWEPGSCSSSLVFFKTDNNQHAWFWAETPSLDLSPPEAIIRISMTRLSGALPRQPWSFTAAAADLRNAVPAKALRVGASLTPGAADSRAGCVLALCLCLHRTVRSSGMNFEKHVSEQLSQRIIVQVPKFVSHAVRQIE